MRGQQCAPGHGERRAAAGDLANNTLPNFSVVVLNVCNDMHDCSVATGHTWLSQWLPVILNSQSYGAGTHGDIRAL